MREAGIANRPDESVKAKLGHEASRSPLPHFERASPPAADARQQPDQPLVHVAVHLLKPPGGVPGAKVVAPATQDGVEDHDDLPDVPQTRPTTAVRKLPDAGADASHRPRGRPPENILPPFETREHYTQVAAQEDESLLAEP